MRSLSALGLILLSILLVESQIDTQSNNGDFHSHFFARSPMQQPLQGNPRNTNRGRPPLDFRDFGTAEERSIILTGVGKAWQATQKSAIRESAGLREQDRRHGVYGEAREYQDELRQRNRALIGQGKTPAPQDIADVRKTLTQFWTEYEAKKTSRTSPALANLQALRKAEQTVAQARQDILSLGLINKDMRSRMMKAFQPAKRSGAKARGVREKAGGPKEGKRKYTRKAESTRTKSVGRLKKSGVDVRRGMFRSLVVGDRRAMASEEVALARMRDLIRYRVG